MSRSSIYGSSIQYGGDGCMTAEVGFENLSLGRLKMQEWKMREWKYRHESEEKCCGGKYGSGNIGTVLQRWNMRESRLWLIEKGLTSHSTQFRSFRRRCFTGQITQPTVSKHWRRVVSYPDSSQSHQAHLTVLQLIQHAAMERQSNTKGSSTTGVNRVFLLMLLLLWCTLLL